MYIIPSIPACRIGLAFLLGTATLCGQQMVNETLTDLNDAVPFGESEVTAMAPLPNGELLLTCGGTRAHLVTVHPTNRTTRIVQSWPKDQRAHSLVMRGNQFWMIVGHDPDKIIDETLTAPREQLVAGTWNNGKITLTELGAPTSGLGIATLAADADGEQLYLITRPTPILYRFTPATKTFTLLATLGKAESYEETITWKAPCERVSNLPQHLLVTATNRVSGFYKGILFHWSPPPTVEPGKRPISGLVTTKLSVPSASDRSGTEGVRVESWLQMRDGTLFGGTFDGYLFSMDAEMTRIVNLGKPFRQGGIRALVETSTGALIGICGEAGFRNRIFTYAPETGYREITMKRSKLQFPYETLSTLALLPDGMLCIGGRGRMTAVLAAQLPVD